MPPRAFQSVSWRHMLLHFPVFIWHHEGKSASPDFLDSSNPSVRSEASFTRWQSATQPDDRTTRLPACFALSTSPTWSGGDAVWRTTSLFTLTGFYDPAASPRLVLGAWADAWICSDGSVIKLELTMEAETSAVNKYRYKSYRWGCELSLLWTGSFLLWFDNVPDKPESEILIY